MVAFAPRPTYRPWDRASQLNIAFDQPFSLSRNLGEQFQQGIVDSYGLGTVMREGSIPRGNTEQRGLEPQLFPNPFDAAGRIAQTIGGMIRGDQAQPSLSEDEYKSSPYFRTAVPWEQGMTQDRAAALASFYDQKQVRNYFGQKRPFSTFAGQLFGQALDPINYVPLFGPTMRAAVVARAGGIGGRALLGASEAAINTAAFGVMSADTRARFGDDVSWQMMSVEIGMSALIGGAFGAGIGVLSSRGDARAKQQQRAITEAQQTAKNSAESLVPLNEAIDAIASGREVDLSPNGLAPIERVRQGSEQRRSSGKYATFDDPAVRPVDAGAVGAPDSRSGVAEVFHGTLRDFERFDTTHLGSETQTADAREGFFFAADPRVAEGYAIDDPYRDLANGLLDNPVGRVYVRFNEMLAKIIYGRGFIKRGQVLRAKLSFDNAKYIDAGGREPNAAEQAQALQQARAEGHDAVVFKNSRDAGYTDASDLPTDVYVVFDPKRIEIVSRHKSAKDAQAATSEIRRLAAPPAPPSRQNIRADIDRGMTADAMPADLLPEAREIIDQMPPRLRDAMKAKTTIEDDLGDTVPSEDYREAMGWLDAAAGRESPVRKIEATMRERFTAAGRPEREAEASAALISEFYRTTAQRAGMALDDLMQQFPLPEIRRGGELEAEALNQSARDLTNTPEFANWFAESKVVDAEGRPLVVYHGSARSDRIHDAGKFDRRRATSGPMSFFTDNPEIASSYATKKQDTSLPDEESYAQRFLVKPAGYRGKPRRIDQMWWALPPDERARMSRLAQRVMFDDEAEAIILAPEGHTSGNGNFDWEIKQARGNVLQALNESWLSSGSLFDQEELFLDVLRLAGMESPVTYVDPNMQAGGVVPVYLSIQRPLDTSAIPEEVIDALKAAAKGRRAPRYSTGKDMWDKTAQNPKEWVARLELDRKEGTAHAWTSIPDWVTDALRAQGFDGIKDTGGKGGGVEHAVWIPFDETQVKSRFNRGTFDPTDPRLLFQPSTENAGDGSGDVGVAGAGARSDMPSASDETIPNATRVAAQELRDLLVPDTGIIQSLGDIEVSDRVRVMAVMRTLAQDLQVAERVVPLVPVDVVDVLGRQELTAKALLDNPAMLVDLLPVNADDLVARNIAAVDKLADAMTRATTEDAAGLNMASVAGEGRAADGAGQSDHRNTMPQPYGLNNPRGSIRFDDTGSTISLFENADASTALHESGHHFLTMFKSLAERPDAPAEMASDWNMVKAWWASNADAVAADSPTPVTGADVRAVLETGTSGDAVKDLGINVGLQEQWARGFEAYLREGIAPTEGLRGIFRQFAQWLGSIYRKALDLNVNISDDIRGVFDRMLAPAPQAAPNKIDASVAAPDPIPDGLDLAAARVGKGEDIRQLAEQHGVNVADGSFAEQFDIDQMRAEGRLTPEDEAAIQAADAEFEAAEAWGNSLKAAAACMLG